MKEYFMPTGKKVLGVVILLFLFSMVGIIPYMADPTKFVTGQYNVILGWPMPYVSIDGGSLSNINTVNIAINAIIFYLVICLLGFILKGGKEKNVPNSNIGGGNTGSADKTQP